MPAMSVDQGNAQKAADIIRDAGGEVIGRTRLQKMAYILEIAGLGSGFLFEYRHYGPFSEELADAVANAQIWDLLTEDQRTAHWGGSYSIFRSASKSSKRKEGSRGRILELCVKANPVSLELAATAAFLAAESTDPWAETSRRKPEKASKFLQDAKTLYAALRSVETPRELPMIQ